MFCPHLEEAHVAKDKCVLSAAWTIFHEKMNCYPKWSSSWQHFGAKASSNSITMVRLWTTGWATFGPLLEQFWRPFSSRNGIKKRLLFLKGSWWLPHATFGGFLAVLGPSSEAWSSKKSAKNVQTNNCSNRSFRYLSYGKRLLDHDARFSILGPGPKGQSQGQLAPRDPRASPNSSDFASSLDTQDTTTSPHPHPQGGRGRKSAPSGGVPSNPDTYTDS